MSSLFEDLSLGLQQAIDYEKGIGSAKKYEYIINPVSNYSGDKIREIRMKKGMTQIIFALYMGVSKKTVEAWEHGTVSPSGSARRLLEILDNDDFNTVPFVKRQSENN